MASGDPLGSLRDRRTVAAGTAGAWSCAGLFGGCFAVDRPRSPPRADSTSEPRSERPPHRVEPAVRSQGSRNREKLFSDQHLGSLRSDAAAAASGPALAGSTFTPPHLSPRNGGLSTPANTDAVARVLVRCGFDRPETLRSSDGGPVPSSGPKWSLHELVPLEVSPHAEASSVARCP